MQTNQAEDQPRNKVKGKGRFILTVPPDFSFKGDPPHWIRQLFLEPLVDGWKREIVIRTTPIKNKKADIYYYSPDGTKFRSRREIGQYLQDEGITKYSPVFNFWFCGKILGEEFAPYEVVRPSQPLLAKMEESCSSNAGPVPEDIISEDDDVSDTDSQPASPDYSEEGMIFDEEIEIDTCQDAFVDPAVLRSLGDQLLPIELPVVRERRKPKVRKALPAVNEQPAPKKRKMSQGPTTIKTETAEPKRRYCVCDDVEHGQMVLCDNKNCEIEWYHFKCVNIQASPPGPWFCPVCRGPTSAVLNPAYGVQNELCR